jgi:deoxyribodipyrimidine photo-lyase
MSEQDVLKNMSENLRCFADDPRVLVRRGGEPRRDGRAVVYWMQRAQRALDNPALELAIKVANELGLPVVVFFSVIPNYPNANLRHYHFMQQGLRDVAADLTERGIRFVVRCWPQNTLDELLTDVDAALVIGDENPCREPERWRQVLATKLQIPYWTVDADVVVPSRIFGKSFFMLQHFRPKLATEMPHFLHRPRPVKPLYAWKSKLRSDSLEGDLTAGFKQLDRSIGPVDSFTGGTHAALKLLRSFVEKKLATYDADRNRPEVDGTSRMSPYLHFGNISPITIVVAVDKALAAGRVIQATRDRYVEELVGWRELAVLFVEHNPNYDSWECAEPWARKSLTEHVADPRPWVYSLAQFERAETHDELWNACQMQMVRFGWMHNYLRMFWAKKILEWSASPAAAFEIAVILNDKYQLDGRDPNGYAGIAWAVVGKHDRPWFNRPVFGLVRSMTSASTAKKFDAKRYIRNVRDGLPFG